MNINQIISRERRGMKYKQSHVHWKLEINNDKTLIQPHWKNIKLCYDEKCITVKDKSYLEEPGVIDNRKCVQNS